jgi:tryptophan synthase alpha chain
VGAQRIRDDFRRANDDGRAALVAYLVAGYPDAATSLHAALAAIDAGADLLEIGLPYSDPLGDGPTIQRASTAALGAGATFASSVRLVEAIAKARPGTPLVAMAYANQVLGGGDGTAVAQRLADAGASGTIVIDLTPDEGAPYEAVAGTAGLAVIYLVAPTTPPDRRAWIARRTGGFLYCVSLLGVTGARQSLPSSVGTLIRDTVAVSPGPVAVGFGIGRREQARAVARAGAAGIVVGSALVNALGHDGRDTRGLARLVAQLRAGTVR